MAPKGKSAVAMERQARAIGDMNSKKSLNAVNTTAALAAGRARAAKDRSALGGPAEVDDTLTTPGTGVAGARIGKKTGGRGKKKKKARSADVSWPGAASNAVDAPPPPPPLSRV